MDALQSSTSYKIYFGTKKPAALSQRSGFLTCCAQRVLGSLWLPERRSAGHLGAVLDAVGVEDSARDHAVECGDHIGVPGVGAVGDGAALSSLEVGACLHGQTFVVLVDHHDLLDIARGERAGVLRDGELCAHHLERVGVLVVADDGGLELERKRIRTHGDDVTRLDLLAFECELLEHGALPLSKVRMSGTRMRLV